MGIDNKNNSLTRLSTNQVLTKVYNTSNQIETSNLASYKGVALKTIIFLVCCFVGVVIFFIFHALIMEKTRNPIYSVSSDGIFYVYTCVTEIVIMSIVGLFVLIVPFFAWSIGKRISIVGAIYAFCEGYFVGTVMSFLTAEYRWIPLVAFLLTLSVVFSMLLFYKNSKIKIGGRFLNIILVFLSSILLTSVVLLLLYFIPFTNYLVRAILTFVNSPLISIAISIVFLILSIVFLISDFENVRQIVENKMDKKLEWMASFGLIYTIIYIYFRFLEILIKIVRLTKKDS